MSLATYEDARPWAKAIKEEVLEKRMPPWHAVKGYGEFRNAPGLTQRDIDILVNWVEGGAPKGDDKDLPVVPLYSTDWQLGTPDLILKPESETKIAADADEYRSFELATNLKEERWLSAIDLQPGNGSVVHCATFFLTKGETGAQSPAAEGPRDSRPESPPESPLESMMQVRDERSDLSRLNEQSVFATWMPGQKTIAFPDGVAKRLAAGSRIDVRIHYRGAGEAASDLSRVGLYFARTQPRKHIQQLLLSKPDAVIPVSAGPQQIKTAITTQTDTEAVAIRPRVHPLVISLQATAYLPDGSEQVLIWSRGFQFDWEPTCYFRQPIVLPKGTRIEVIAYLDNSDDNSHNPNNPPKALTWSELSREPLCALLVASSVGQSGSAITR